MIRRILARFSWSYTHHHIGPRLDICLISQLEEKK